MLCSFTSAIVHIKRTFARDAGANFFYTTDLKEYKSLVTWSVIVELMYSISSYLVYFCLVCTASATVSQQCEFQRNMRINQFMHWPATAFI